MINKIKKNIKAYYLYYLSFFFVSFFFLFILLIYNIRPFGDNTILTGDGYSQFYPFLIKYKDAILNHEFIINWNEGLGSPFYRLFLIYLSSPINIIALLFDNKNMDIAIYIIIYIKLLLSGISIIYYLKNKFNNNKLVILIPSLLYVFSGYFLAYYNFVQWLDMLYMLPLLTLGIEKLIKDHKVCLYIISLIYILISSIYIGYMMCIYTIIYFVIYNLIYVKGNNIKDKINNLSKNFLIILGVSAISILIVSPLLYLFSYTSSTMGGVGGGFPTKRIYEFSYLDFFISGLSGVEKRYIATSSVPPNIYTGLISILLIIPFIFNKNINKKDKILLLSMLFILFLFFRIPILDFIMNGFHIPNGISYRYSFIYIFVLTILLAYQLIKSDDNKLSILISCILNSILIIYVLINKSVLINNTYLIISLVLIILYSLILLCKNKTIFLLILVSLEIGLSMYKAFDGSHYFDNRIISVSNDINKDYIFHSIDDYDNKAYINNYNDISAFNSVLYDDVNNLFRLNGVDASNVYYRYNPNTYIFNTLFNIKYFDYDNYNNRDISVPINNELYEYKYSLSKVYGVKDYIDISDFDMDCFDNQNKIMSSFTGIDNILVPVEVDGKKIYEDDHTIIFGYNLDEYTSYTYSGEDVFFVLNSDTIYSVGFVNIKYIDLFDKDIHSVINRMKTINSSYDKITVAYYKNKYSTNNSLKFYRVDMNKFKSAYNYLADRQLIVDNMDTVGLSGSIDAQEDMNMFTVIPYDEGWHVYVDGKEVEINKVLESMVGFKITNGKHRIELKYKIPKFKECLIVSFSTIIIIVLYNIFKKVRKNGNW